MVFPNGGFDWFAFKAKNLFLLTVSHVSPPPIFGCLSPPSERKKGDGGNFFWHIYHQHFWCVLPKHQDHSMFCCFFVAAAAEDVAKPNLCGLNIYWISSIFPLLYYNFAIRTGKTCSMFCLTIDWDPYYSETSWQFYQNLFPVWINLNQWRQKIWIWKIGVTLSKPSKPSLVVSG